jgi:mannose-6-phosphate isomerase-like protein (cupin superfamily)
MARDRVFQVAELDEITARAKQSAGGYAGEVLRSELLSVGLYVLPAGGVDEQAPHTEDEVYYAVRGHSRFRVGDSDVPVRPGTLLFVPAETAHFFHDISEELILVVFWAPPEGSARGKTKDEP